MGIKVTYFLDYEKCNNSLRSLSDKFCPLKTKLPPNSLTVSYRLSYNLNLSNAPSRNLVLIYLIRDKISFKGLTFGVFESNR